MVTLSPPTSEAGVWFLERPQVGKLVVVLPLVGSLQYRTLTNCMCWFPLPFHTKTLYYVAEGILLFTVCYPCLLSQPYTKAQISLMYNAPT